MSDKFAADYPLLVSREQARNAEGDALRLFVGRGRRYSVKELANATGVPDWQINAAMVNGGHPDNRPLPPEARISIALFLGVAFTNKWLCLADQRAVECGEIDHDDLAAGCIDYAARHARARHPESPGGVEIVTEEHNELTETATARLRVVA